MLSRDGGEQYILLAGKKIPVTEGGDYRLILVRDISSLYRDIRDQAFFYLAVYFGMAVLAVLLVFFSGKKDSAASLGAAEGGQGYPGG